MKTQPRYKRSGKKTTRETQPKPYVKELVDFILKSGLGNTLRVCDFENAGYGNRIKYLMEKYPDSLFPEKELESGCGCSLLHGELIDTGKRRGFALRG